MFQPHFLAMSALDERETLVRVLLASGVMLSCLSLQSDVKGLVSQDVKLDPIRIDFLKSQYYLLYYHS